MRRRDPKIQRLLDDQLVEPKVFTLGPPPIRMVPEGELYRFGDYEPNKPRAPLRRRPRRIMNLTTWTLLVVYALLCAAAVIIVTTAAPSTP